MRELFVHDRSVMTPQKSIFQRPVWVTVFALTAAIAWGWAYPLIKLGFGEFGITPDMAGSKMLFAGIRFCISGLIILSIAGVTKREFKVRQRSDWWYILLFCMLNTTLHYAFFYFGLSHSEGIVSLNLGGADSGRFSLLGDGMIILNALCGASASLLIRGLGKRVDVFVGTGYSLAIGGTLLVLPGIFLGGEFPMVTVTGCLYLVLLIAISTMGFTLYNKLLTCNPVGKVAIYNSLIPVVGAVTSCLCLDEQFQIKYVIAGALAATGIYIINRSK